MSYVSFGWNGRDRDIEVFLKDGVWMTRHTIDGAPDEQLARMLGSHELPTPWKEDTDRETVIQELAVRNQHATVH